jgi:predicted acetyltransferase
VGFAEPQMAMLDSYSSALLKGWSPNNVSDVSQQELLEIKADPDAFIASRRDDAPIDGRTIELPNGSRVQRLPMRLRWIWDGDFCGQIGLRWQPGMDMLPEHVLGHIGYGVVPWKRSHGLAKRALRHMLGEARDVGLKRLQITTEPINFASQKVILANGGRFDGGFVSHYNGSAHFRYIIDLA